MDLWRDAHESVSYTTCSERLTLLKKELPWLSEADSTSLQQALRHLDRAYANFFEKKSGFPKFKKRSHEQKYSTVSGTVAIEGSRVRLPKLGMVKISKSKDICGRIVGATVTKTPGGRYYITLRVEEDVVTLQNNGGEIGIDLGLKALYTDSNGRSISNPKVLRKHERRLRRLQRRLSRKQKGSNNRNKARLRVAREHERIADIREDILNKEAHRLAIENQVVCVENLNVQGMMKNHKLAKSIGDASWAMLVRRLEWQLEKHGGILVKVSRFYPSSQTCSACGEINPEVKDLRVREWICPCCGTVHDRDENAAINIKREGLRLLAS